MTRLIQTLLAMFLLFAQFLMAAPAYAQEEQEGAEAERIESLTRKIVLKETELIRLNTSFRINATRVSRGKIWRLFAYNLLASSSCDSGAISIAYTRWNNYRHPQTLTPRSAAVGPMLLLIGHSIVLAGVSVETILDKFSDAKIRRQGLDIKSTHEKIMSIRQELNAMLDERDKLLSNSMSVRSYLAAARAEQAVLKDIEGLALNDYALFFVRANKYFANRNTSAFLTVASAATGEFAGTLPGIIAGSERKPRAVETAGVGFPISGGLIVLTPILTRLAANLKGGMAAKTINDELPEIRTVSLNKLEEDKLAFRKCLEDHAGSHSNLNLFARRLEAYEKESQLFRFQINMNQTENKLANRELRERMLFASLIGGSKISWGVNLATAGFGYKDAKRTIFTSRTAIGATTYIPGNSLWLLDTLQNQIRTERREQKLAENKNRPSDLLNERMDRLEEINGVFNY